MDRIVYLVSESYGDWIPIAVYETLEKAKSIEPLATWELDRQPDDEHCVGTLRNFGKGRDLFITPLELI